MATSENRSTANLGQHWGLKCPNCGNEGRFLELMADESHVVDAKLMYIHLATADVDRYVCLECWEDVEPAWLESRK
jgi:hypothetical protein